MIVEKEELTPLQAKRKALEEARAAKLAERKARDAATVDDRAVADLEALEKAEAEYGEVGKMLGEIKTPVGVVIVRKPKYGEWRRYQDGKKGPEEQDTLVYSCVVHPPLPEFRKLTHDFPALEVAVGNMLMKLAGSEMAGDIVPK
jgi:hypothetical protein